MARTVPEYTPITTLKLGSLNKITLSLIGRSLVPEKTACCTAINAPDIKVTEQKNRDVSKIEFLSRGWNPTQMASNGKENGILRDNFMAKAR